MSALAIAIGLALLGFAASGAYVVLISIPWARVIRACQRWFALLMAILGVPFAVVMVAVYLWVAWLIVTGLWRLAHAS